MCSVRALRSAVLMVVTVVVTVVVVSVAAVVVTVRAVNVSVVVMPVSVSVLISRDLAVAVISAGFRFERKFTVIDLKTQLLHHIIQDVIRLVTQAMRLNL